MRLMLIMFCSGIATTCAIPAYCQKATKVMVLAKLDNAGHKKNMENIMASRVKSTGAEVLTAHATLTEGDMASEEAFKTKLTELGVEGLIVFSDGTLRKAYKNKPSVNAGLGVPVKIGIFKGYIGGNVPLAGGVRQQSKVTLHVYYFDKFYEGIRWDKVLKGNLNNGTEALAQKFANATLKQLTKKGYL
jgi:hypothetical protein